MQSKRQISTIIFIWLCLIIFLLPIFTTGTFRVPFFSKFKTDFLILLSVYLIPVTILIEKSKIPYSFSDLFIYSLFILILSLFYIASFWISKSTDISIQYWKALIIHCLFSIMILLTLRNYYRYKTICNLMVLGSIIVSLVSLAKLVGIIPLEYPVPEKQYLDLNIYIQSNIMYGIKTNYGTFFTSGRFSMWQSFGLCFLSYILIFEKRHYLKKFLCLIGCVMIISSIIIALSRNAILVSSVGIIILLFIKIHSSWKRSSLYGRVLISCLFSIFLFLCILYGIKIFYFAESVRGFEGRFDQWRLAFFLLQDHWFFGIGPGVFSLFAVLNPFMHNTYLQIWLASGFISLILFIFLFLFPIIHIFKFLKINYSIKNLSSPGVYSLTICMIVVNACWMLALLFFPGLHIHEVWLAIGLISSLPNLIRNEKLLTS